MCAKPLLAVISQGCAANFGEGEKIARIFEAEYKVVFGLPAKGNADKQDELSAAFILNVCTVKGNATALKLLREAMQLAPSASLLITGCAPKDLRDEVAKINANVRFTSLAELSREKELREGCEKDVRGSEKHHDFADEQLRENKFYDGSRKRDDSESKVRSSSSKGMLRESKLIGIVNIEEGCLDACAYCSTRLVKGRLRSYPAEAIVEQVRSLVEDGCIEIQLTGQDCGCYGFDIETEDVDDRTADNSAGSTADISVASCTSNGTANSSATGRTATNSAGSTADNSAGSTADNSAGSTAEKKQPRNLAELVKKILAEVPGDYRMRLGMGNPRHILRYLDELLDCFNDKRLYKFIHLPVQSGSPHILQAMNRKHTAQDYAHLAAAFTSRFPLFTLSTDLIVGFPGETDEDFADTLQVLQKTRPTVCNITRFVSRPGTPASRLPDAVPDEVKHKRSAELAAAFQQIAVENNRAWIGQTEQVTIEKVGYRKGTVIARNDAYRPVAITVPESSSPDQYKPGTRITVRIQDAEAFALIGEPI